LTHNSEILAYARKIRNLDGRKRVSKAGFPGKNGFIPPP
jgi:hypothetical protein